MLYTATRLSSHTDPIAGHELLDKLYSVLKTSSSHSIQTALLFCKVLWLKVDNSIETGKFVEARNGLVSCILFFDHGMEERREGKEKRRGEGRGEEREGEKSLCKNLR